MGEQLVTVPTQTAGYTATIDVFFFLKKKKKRLYKQSITLSPLFHPTCTVHGQYEESGGW